MEKKIVMDLPSKKLKLSDYLPHQFGKCGEVINGHKFLAHLNHEHRGYCPERSLIDGSPFRYWLFWYDYRNYERFTKTVRKPQIIRADPPWIAPN